LGVLIIATFKRHPSSFWIGLLLILMLAAALRLLSYSFSLPFIDNVDESDYYLAGLEWRGSFDSRGYFAVTPPAYIALQAGLQPILESMGIRDLAATTQVMRFLSVVVNLVTLILIALTARLAAGDLAGWVAGAAWGIAPTVLENGVYALPDPWVYFLCAMALWLAAEALVNPKRQWWCIGSVAVALLAIAMKYPAAPALAPGVVVALVITIRDRRKGLTYLALQMALIVATGLWFLLVYKIDFANLPREGAVVQSQGVANLFNLSRLANNLYYTVFPLNPIAFGLIVLLGIAAFVFLRERRLSRLQLGVAGLALLMAVTIPWLASMFNEVNIDKIRYVLPATAAVCVLMGVALAQVAKAVPKRWAYGGGAWVVLPLIAQVFIPQLAQDWRLVQNRHLPDRRVQLRQWFDANLEPGTVIVDQDNHMTFNGIYGGIPYKNWVDWWVSDNIMEYPLDEWRDQRGMSYAVISKGQIEQMNTSAEGRDYLAGMLHLRDFFTGGMRGPEMAIYRLRRMQIETRFTFGDTIRLVGYDYNDKTAKPGDVLTLHFYWQAMTMPTDNYSLFIHVVPEDEYTILAQGDGAPASPDRPTLLWSDPGETLISLAFDIALPPDLPAGEYRVMIGLYNYLDGARLPIKDENGVDLGDALELMRIHID
jgi:4-amino-4-deoxy-L-arabinose transferase-like glycosyltransferase